ncbi:MAG TPA: acyloxyacyl hydrolase [Flavobacteriaceae bacterium]|nr:acyloxyacyl hydrolase [Flavobacteriaceae bacterium]MCB9213048.1 acyloxyacyl hydrolase [Alteromonas sp.]HPF10953.1 acyloxyacyl hydrolase [Flavobacteriaceae bacterium]HQU20305.1 acyloxyacyl hydrolase [Flavobacteriaceae bacterium]HQU64197.1 acyloxyacyl hydrolase [Flavobacteriaceae bacterium]
MKNFCYFGILILSVQLVFAQQNEVKPVSLSADYFYGSILEHNSDIAHLITGHPTGLILSYNRKTYGYNEWESRYNYPDWGFTFTYQDLKNEYLGENFGFYGHFNWYFWNRMLRIGVAQGIAYANNPYDPETNFQNNAYGSHFLSTTMVRAELIKENIYKGIGAHVGFGIIHYSNANFKAPNNSTNTLYFSGGLSYQLKQESFPARISYGNWRSKFYSERIKYNAVFRTGVNEADVNGLGVYPFYTFSFFADKRINYKSTFQVGVDVFFSNFLIHLMDYRRIAFPGEGIPEGLDYRRVGVFLGHELRFNRVAFVSQLGRYVYWPYEFENRIYNRLGLKRYFFNDSFFVSATVKAHWAKAEAVEFSAGVRI